MPMRCQTPRVRPRDRSAAAKPFDYMLMATLVAGVTTAGAVSAAAKPLDGENCARLKLQREALEASGVRSAIAAAPPTVPPRRADEQAKNIAALIYIEGQLRFRCNVELPIASLRPDLLRDIPDTIDGDIAPGAPTVAAKRPAVKRATTDGKSVTPTAPTPTPGTRAPTRAKTAGAATKSLTPADQPSAASPVQDTAPTKPRPKPRVKSDDAFKGPTPGKADTPSQ